MQRKKALPNAESKAYAKGLKSGTNADLKFHSNIRMVLVVLKTF